MCPPYLKGKLSTGANFQFTSGAGPSRVYAQLNEETFNGCRKRAQMREG